jgi:hypothetical protein
LARGLKEDGESEVKMIVSTHVCTHIGLVWFHASGGPEKQNKDCSPRTRKIQVSKNTGKYRYQKIQENTGIKKYRKIQVSKSTHHYVPYIYMSYT